MLSKSRWSTVPLCASPKDIKEDTKYSSNKEDIWNFLKLKMSEEILENISNLVKSLELRYRDCDNKDDYIIFHQYMMNTLDKLEDELNLKL